MPPQNCQAKTIISSLRWNQVIFHCSTKSATVSRGWATQCTVTCYQQNEKYKSLWLNDQCARDAHNSSLPSKYWILVLMEMLWTCAPLIYWLYWLQVHFFMKMLCVWTLCAWKECCKTLWLSVRIDRYFTLKSQLKVNFTRHCNIPSIKQCVLYFCHSIVYWLSLFGA